MKKNAVICAWDAFYIHLAEMSSPEHSLCLAHKENGKTSVITAERRNLAAVYEFTQVFFQYRMELKSIKQLRNVKKVDRNALFLENLMSALHGLLDALEAITKDRSRARKYLLKIFCEFLELLKDHMSKEQFEQNFWGRFAEIFYNSLPEKVAIKISANLDWIKPVKTFCPNYPKCKSFSKVFTAHLELMQQRDEKKEQQSFKITEPEDQAKIIKQKSLCTAFAAKEAKNALPFEVASFEDRKLSLFHNDLFKGSAEAWSFSSGN